MKTKLWIIALIALTGWTQVYACTGFLTGESTSGMNKICYYDHLGSAHAMTLKSYQVCPVSIQIRH